MLGAMLGACRLSSPEGTGSAEPSGAGGGIRGGGRIGGTSVGAETATARKRAQVGGTGGGKVVTTGEDGCLAEWYVGEEVREKFK